MKHAFNSGIHLIGACAIAFGFILMVKAAGLADLGGTMAEITHNGTCGLAAAGLGALLSWWNV